MRQSTEDNSGFSMTTVHKINAGLLCLLLLETGIGYFSVPAPTPANNHLFGMHLWGMGRVPYWFQPMLYILLFTVLAYLIGFVYDLAQDDSSGLYFCGAGMTLFLGCVVQIVMYLNVRYQGVGAAPLMIVAVILIILVSLWLSRYGYDKGD